MEDCSSSDSSMCNFMEDSTTTTTTTTSSSFSSLHSLSCEKHEEEEEEEGHLFHMSSLMALLPLKRGLSKHFQGKSKSFTSLSNVRSLRDLVKPERKMAYKKKKKKIKACKSYEGSLDSSKSSLTLRRLSSITITKKPLRQRSSRVL